MAEARNIKVKLTVDTSEFEAATRRIRDAVAELPWPTVATERIEDEDKPE